MNKEDNQSLKKTNIFDPKEKDLYIFGHKNPDTDSICTTLAYARLKEKLGYKYVHACRLGDINKETAYVMNRFNYKLPTYIDSIKPQVSDLKVYDAGTINSREDIKTAKDLMNTGENKKRIIPVASDKGKLIGVVSNSNIMNCIEEFYKSEMLENEIYISNLIKNLEPYEVLGSIDVEKVNSKIYVDSSLNSKKLNKNDIIIATNENITKNILEENSNFILIVPSIGNVDFVNNYSEKEGMLIIKTDMGLLHSLHMISQSISVYSIMSNSEIEYFELEEYIEEVMPQVANSKYTHFPIVDKDDIVKGVLSRRHLLNYQKKNVVLIDHNEISQTINGIREANILEVIDHHKLDSISTNYPPFLRVEPVGCTATVVYKLYLENHVPIEKYEAILMLSSILSDTLILRSPTCTQDDVKAATELAKISDLKIEDYGKEMISSALNISDDEWEDVIRSDVKRFKVGDYDIEISNINISDYEKILQRKEFIKGKMYKAMAKDRCDTFILMLTDITNQGALIMVAGGDGKIFNYAFGMPYGTDNIFLPGVLSRKKQVLPKVLKAVDIVTKSK